MKQFTKNDNSFVCINCKAFVPVLKTTSRNHCNSCLYSLHVDINPGDRANECKGVLEPVGLVTSGKKGYIIQYKCKKCGAVTNNRSAVDDNFEELLKLCKKQ